MDYAQHFTGYSTCQCGAITLMARTGQNYSCSLKNRAKYLPRLDLRKLTRFEPTYCCDHCVNRWGLDLCACGSGESPEECQNELPECGHPMQELLGTSRPSMKI